MKLWCDKDQDGVGRHRRHGRVALPSSSIRIEYPTSISDIQ